MRDGGRAKAFSRLSLALGLCQVSSIGSTHHVGIDFAFPSGTVGTFFLQFLALHNGDRSYLEKRSNDKRVPGPFQTPSFRVTNHLLLSSTGYSVRILPSVRFPLPASSLSATPLNTKDLPAQPLECPLGYPLSYCLVQVSRPFYWSGIFCQELICVQAARLSDSAASNQFLMRCPELHKC